MVSTLNNSHIPTASACYFRDALSQHLDNRLQQRCDSLFWEK